MASQWILKSNDIVVKTQVDSGLSTGEKWDHYDHVQEYTSTYRDCMHKAAHIRWLFISYNGYNPIRVTRSKDKITYTVIAHFGMPQYTLATIERV